MSKFFKALENAERERQASDGADGGETTSKAEAAKPAAPPAPAAVTPPAPAAPAAASPKDAPVAPPAPAPKPVAKPAPVAAPAPVAKPEPVATPARVVTPAPVAAPLAAPPPVAKPTPVPAPIPVATPAPAPRPAPMAPPVPEPPAPARPQRARSEPATARPPAYGAPLAREMGGVPSHRRAFTGVLEPQGAAEPGQIDDHLVSLLEPTSLAAEQYRTVRLHIETLHRERGLKLIAISSPSRGDGKTLSAINLAGALAQAPDAKVVLVEVDVRHPGVGQYLGLSAARGLSSFLLDQSTAVESIIERPSGVGFAVVVAGPASSMPYELLKSPRLTALFSALRERFDYVVVDTPPVLPFPDVGILRDLVDGFLLVVRANRTPREMVRDSLATIGQPRVLGVVFNDDERTAVEVNGNGAGWRSYLKPLGGARAA